MATPFSFAADDLDCSCRPKWWSGKSPPLILLSFHLIPLVIRQPSLLHEPQAWPRDSAWRVTSHRLGDTCLRLLRVIYDGHVSVRDTLARRRGDVRGWHICANGGGGIARGQCAATFGRGRVASEQDRHE